MRSFALPEKFSFDMGKIVPTVLPSLVPLQRIDDCVEIHTTGLPVPIRPYFHHFLLLQFPCQSQFPSMKMREK